MTHIELHELAHNCFMGLSWDDWYKSVDRFLVSRRRGVRVWELDHGALTAGFGQGTPPAVFATQPTLPIGSPAPTQPAQQSGPLPWVVARQRQAVQVLNDPRYLLDTGLGMGCPTCGSTNLANKGKAKGTGLMFFGSLAWVLAASLADSAIAQKLSGHLIECNYCAATFNL